MTTKWTSTSISNLYRRSNKLKTTQNLFNSELRGEIPKAQRISRGATKVRYWKTEDLPLIGLKYGFISAPANPTFLSFYTAKGGTLKTTMSYNFARILALNGLKVLIIGLDIQLSITEAIAPTLTAESLENLTTPTGLYDFLYRDCSISEVVKSTDLPNLFYIPETPELQTLEKNLKNESRKEYFFLDKLKASIGNYDVIIFDNSPSWSSLTENSLVCSDSIISPVGCEINSYRAMKQHLDFLRAFKKTMRLKWHNIIAVPTLLEKTNISQQIYGSYLNQYPDCIVSTPIRRSVKGHESSMYGISILEYDSLSTLSEDYLDLMLSICPKLLPLNNVS